jgi:hypothetical protein
MPTFDDLVATDSTILLRAIGERLALIEMNELEAKCLVPRLDVHVKIYGQLQALLAAARRRRGLADTVEPLREIWLPGDDDPERQHALDDPGDLVNLGRHHALLTRRHVELQQLYQTRLEVTRRALQGSSSLP